jgi:predicted transcriptional regulator
MGTVAKQDIRKEVKKYIDQADDRMVKIIYTMLEADQAADWWDEISDEERASIDRGLQQLDEGKGIPHEQVVKQYAKWFAK